MSEPFIAEVRIFAGNFAPRGWAFCNGQLLPISQNTALFSLIGTTYGGDGRSTTALPNLQGRVPMHPGRGPGLTARRLGERVGVETVTLTETQIPSHNHQLRGVADRPDPDPQGSQPGPTKSVSRSMGGKAFGTNPAHTADMSSAALSVDGGGQAHENMQPFLAINYIIALQGLFPSRG